MSSNLPVVNVSELAKGLVEARQRSATEDGDFQFMKMLKDGIWQYGADEIEVEEGSKWAVNPHSFMEGFIAWDENEVAGEEMAPMVGGHPVRLSDLPRVDGRGWQKQVAFQLVCTSGEDEGTQVVFKSSSKGGRKAVTKLINDIIEQIGKDPKNIVPVVRLEQDSYKHKTYGKIYTPVFSIVEWTSFESTPAASGKEEGEADEQESEAAEATPKRTRGKTVAPEKAAVEEEDIPADEGEEEAPKRRRRRRTGK